MFFTQVCDQTSVFNISEVVWLPHWVSKLNFDHTGDVSLEHTDWFPSICLFCCSLFFFFFTFLFIFWSLHTSFVGPSSHWQRKQKIIVMPVSNSVLEWSVPLTPRSNKQLQEDNDTLAQGRDNCYRKPSNSYLMCYLHVPVDFLTIIHLVFRMYGGRHYGLSQPDSEAPALIIELLQLLCLWHLGISFGIDTFLRGKRWILCLADLEHSWKMF